MVGLADANSTEFDPTTPHPVVCLLDEQRKITQIGGTMRLGRLRVPARAGHQGARGIPGGADLASGTGTGTR